MDETIKQKFERLVTEGKCVYLSKDIDVKNYLKEVKQRVKEENKHLKPYIDGQKQRCDTCGSVDKAHPDTSFCFVCDTDNWQTIRW